MPLSEKRGGVSDGWLISGKKKPHPLGPREEGGSDAVADDALSGLPGCERVAST